MLFWVFFPSHYLICFSQTFVGGGGSSTWFVPIPLNGCPIWKTKFPLFHIISPMLISMWQIFSILSQEIYVFKLLKVYFHYKCFFNLFFWKKEFLKVCLIFFKVNDVNHFQSFMDGAIPQTLVIINENIFWLLKKKTWWKSFSIPHQHCWSCLDHPWKAIILITNINRIFKKIQ